MKTRTKALLISVSAILLVVCTFFATMAFLTNTTGKVTNTFTVGNVAITLDEAKVDLYGIPVENAERVLQNEYKLIPNHEYTKDPTIHVQVGSEDCWIFAKIENGLGEDGVLNISSTDWELVDGTTDTYAYKEIVSANKDVVVFSTLQFVGSDPSEYKDAKIDITGYAVQADGFATAEAAWTAGFGTVDSE